ncbi:MAG: hypothetical protein M1836_007088 [Candelina mexicana]|nr:MAG: hypothetical protein M1836_007088 [Candelina mexicana]
MVAFAAHTLPQPVLPQRSTRSLCERALAGFCPNGEHCDRSHEICRVPDKPLDPWASTQAIPPFNILLPEPRILAHGPLFDHEGPGSYCEGDYRHDNDHIDIRNIDILPTMDEILSLRPPYMPYKDFHRPHFLRESGENAGTSRLLDTLFRQLRYDSTEQIIDVCYRACQILTFPPQEDILTSDYQFSHATPKGSRFMLFRDICFEESLFHETKGLVLRLSYACPKFLRGRWMHSSGLFEQGMLVALVGLDDIDHALSTTFFEVVLRESTDAMNARGGNGQRASIQLSFAQRDSQDDVRRMLYYAQGVLKGRFVLVDFPKLLLAGFSATLKQLQNQYHKYRLPFATHIAPSDPRSVNLKIEPPTYTKSSGFSFDLNSLRRQDARKADLQMTSVELDLANGSPEIFREQLETATTLDQGQALALSQNLSRGLTFTQGPPGTGKSYLGVSLTKAVVSSQNCANAKPVLAVCMTNHALDSFLEDLVKDGITQVARLGAGSKVEWTRPYTLRELSHKIKLTQLESHNLLRPRIRVEALHREGTRWCESLSTSDLSWCSVRNHLTENYSDIYRQFLALEKPEHSFEGHRAIRHAGGFGFHCWKSGLDIRALNTLSVEFATYLGVDPSTGDTSGSGTRVIESLLAEIVSRSRNLDAIVSSGTSIWSMSPTERTSMVEKWKMEIGPRKFVEQLGEIHRRHQVALLEKKKATQDIDARCLESRQVIGLTTTACATYWPLLHRLGLKVIICEEAGEVMEAHTLCTLFPSIEHAIFIGDPLQLRPQITERALSLETKGGRDYRLDESLFERLMFPSTPGVLPIQPSQLNLQRRMHPDIADISRATLYPYLQDHDSTFKHPAVVGMANRMYWFDHSHSEDPLDSRSATFKSCSNAFEVEMVAGLVQYLIAGNAYDLQDVAILTPYNGQLAALTKRLRSTCSIWLSEKDRETLIDGGFLSVEEAATGGRVQIDLINMLRIATIDNFQGEEAKIIIMSTVRSNLDDRVGFLKTKNRVNVACSRARDGFYIIGNAALMRKVEMWDRIVSLTNKRPAAMFSLARKASGHACEPAAQGIHSAITTCTSLLILPQLSPVKFHVERFLHAVTIATRDYTRNAAIDARRYVETAVETVWCHYHRSICLVVTKFHSSAVSALAKKSNVLIWLRVFRYLVATLLMISARTRISPSSVQNVAASNCLVDIYAQGLAQFAETHQAIHLARVIATRSANVAISVFHYATRACVHLVSNLAKNHANTAAARDYVIRYAILASSNVAGSVFITDSAILCAAYLAPDFHAVSLVQNVPLPDPE